METSQTGGPRPGTAAGSMPRVIIGSPLFNHAKDFREAIESILGQTFTDFALVLVDDCSTDETPQIAKEYAALDRRVSYQVNAQRLGSGGQRAPIVRARTRAIPRSRVLRLGERSRSLASALAAGAGGRARSPSRGRAGVSAQSPHRAVGRSARTQAVGVRHLRHQPIRGSD